MILEMRLNKATIDIIVGLHCFFQEPEEILAWLVAKNTSFDGKTPLYMINRGNHDIVLKLVDKELLEGKVTL